jgi:dimethylamine/trimethylamine dehydrogenase
VASIAEWSINTLERGAIQRRMAEAGVGMMPNTMLLAVEDGRALVRDTLNLREVELPADGVVMVTARLPEDELYYEVLHALERAPDAGVRSVRRVGDCMGPGIIATAIYEGHRYAREIGDEIEVGVVPFRRERLVIDPATA